jgi:transcriptional regulator with XRE-family HTH domain
MPIKCGAVRAARGWSTADLALAASLGVDTANRFETGRDSRLSMGERLRLAMEAAGLLFIREDGDGVGVWVRGPGMEETNKKLEEPTNRRAAWTGT